MTALLDAANPAPIPKTLSFTVDERRQIALEALIATGKVWYPTLVNVQHMSEATLRRSGTRGTIVQVVVNGLRARGVDIGPTVGAVMQDLDMTASSVLQVFGDFLHGDQVSGETSAICFRNQFCLTAA
jgi:hypothetical protein